MKFSASLISLTLITAISLSIQGCASNASHSAMSLNHNDIGTQPNQKLKSALAVRSVTGGKETNPIWTSEVDNAGFKSALSQSISVVGYGAEGRKAKYFVDADLQKLDKPLIGLTFDVTSTVNYKVEGEGFQKNIPITATGSASFSEAWSGVERLRIANEKSIKENIRKFLIELSALVD